MNRVATITAGLLALVIVLGSASITYAACTTRSRNVGGRHMFCTTCCTSSVCSTVCH